MHYLCSCLVVLFVLALYLAIDEMRYRREVKRLQTRPWGAIATAKIAPGTITNRQNRIRHKDAERAVALSMKKVF
jgi:hypothetical protein